MTQSGDRLIKAAEEAAGMNQYSNIIARLEALDGPDREVDAMIWAVANHRSISWHNNDLFAKARTAPYDECYLGSVDPGKVLRNWVDANGMRPPVPSYTASIDAAIELCEKMLSKWERVICTDHFNGKYWAEVFDEHMKDAPRYSHKSAAIALLIAMFKAIGREK